MPKARTDLTGQKFGRLTVVGFDSIRKKNCFWWCLCECGNQKSVMYWNLKCGSTKSCGCFAKESASAREKAHGMSNSPEFKVWMSMRDRCQNRSHKNFYNYGGRGITVCERWLNSFENFISDMGERPSKDHSIDRVNNNGNYEPSNCRWATRKQQSRNKRTNVWVSVEGCVKTIIEWAEVSGQQHGTIRARLLAGWSDYDAVMGKI